MSLEGEFPSILAAARAGAEWALTALYRDLQPRLLRYLQAHEPVAAEDLASEVWLGVAEGLHRFAGDEDAFRAWIFVIARRRMVDYRRRSARRRTMPVAPDELPSRGLVGDVEEEAIAALEGDEVVRRLAVLPPDQADVVLLRVVAGLSVTEVAAVIGKRPGAVRVMQHRALRRLATELARQEVTE
jgi:RNA polymerase sigma-70 factor (ECF subfamily)